MGGLKHISEDAHERAGDGRVYAYARDPFGRPFVVVQPDGARWGVWRTLDIPIRDV